MQKTLTNTLVLGLFLSLALLMGGTIAMAQTVDSTGATPTLTSVSDVKPVGFLDKVQLFFTFNAEKRVDLLQNFGDRNFELAKQKLENGDSTGASIYFQKSDDNTVKASITTSRITDEEKQKEILSNISDSTKNRTTVLSKVKSKVDNEQAKEAIEKAMERQGEIRSSVDEKIQDLLNRIAELEAKIKELEKNGGTSTGSSTKPGTSTNGAGNSTGPNLTNASCNSSTTPYIKVLSPNGGETYHAGDTITVKWKACNVSHPVGITLSGYPYPNDVQFFLGNWSVLASVGSSVVTLPSNAQTGKYLINVSTPPETQNGAEDWSDNFFKITGPSLGNTGGNNSEWGNDVNGRHIGYIKSVSGSTSNTSAYQLVIDYVILDVCPPINEGDRCLINDNTQLRTFQISNNATVTTFNSSWQPVSISLQQFAQNFNSGINAPVNTITEGTMYSLNWITLENGVVTKITPQYLP